jgi:hypothetical protein
MTYELNAPTQLFILRLWQEQLADGSIEWRGKLHHPQTNETRYFRDWPALIPLLLLMLRQAGMPDTNSFPRPTHTQADDAP